MIGLLQNRRKKRLVTKSISRLDGLRDSVESISSIAIVYYIPASQKEKYSNWSDGFVKGINLLSEAYQTTWINLYDNVPTRKEIEEHDMIIFKSCWNWVVDDYRQGLGDDISALTAIMVSCSIKPSLNRLFTYDYIYYETDYYKRQVESHPFTFKVFGIDGDIFRSIELKKKYDILSIGAFKKYKRFHLLSKYSGKKVIIGNKATKEYESLKEKLEGIELLSYDSQEKLAQIINESRLVYIPAALNGGGERAVLEAKACGVPVKVEQDNPKLVTIANGPILTHKDVYRNIQASIDFFNKIRK